MASGDLCDILDIQEKKDATNVSSILKDSKPKQPKKQRNVPKRPKGMHRELFGILYNDNADAPPLVPIAPVYTTAKAKLGIKKARPWKWSSFTNSARSDGASFYHWRRVEDEGQEYVFSKFNRKLDLTMYTDEEYDQLLSEGTDWNKAETDRLFELANQFDCRWHVIFDRFDQPPEIKERPVEELKNRFYNVCNTVKKSRNSECSEEDLTTYDMDHEKSRKKQLAMLFARTREEIKNEIVLKNQLKNIEALKKEKDKKASELTDLGNGNQLKREKRKKRMLKSNVAENEVIPVNMPSFNHLRSRYLKSFDIEKKKARILEQKHSQFVAPSLQDMMGKVTSNVVDHLSKFRQLCITLNDDQNKLISLEKHYEELVSSLTEAGLDSKALLKSPETK